MATTTPAGAKSTLPNAAAKAQYVRDNNVHHLFELLASRVLDKRPTNIFEFLREELVKIEQVEKGKTAHDPSVIRFEPVAAAAHAPAAPPSSSGAPTASATLAPSATAAATPPVAKEGDEPLAVSIGVFGINNAGKSALIAAMGGAPDKNTAPTIGFNPVQFNTGSLNVCVFDLGGAASFRGIWPHYYHDVHGVIYVVDSTDEKSLQETSRVFGDLIGHKYINGKPLLVMANKQDVAGAKSCDHVVETLHVSSRVGSGPWMATGCCAIEPRGDEIDSAVSWLLQTAQHRYTTLSQLIKEHSAEVKAAKVKRLAEQRARVEAEKQQAASQQTATTSS